MRADIAKAVITAQPFSVKHGVYLPARFERAVRAADREIQCRALFVADNFSLDDWRRIQIHKLKRILTHAGKSVPYWRTRFSAVHFQPQWFADFQHLAQIPVTRRVEFKKRKIEEFLSETIPSIRRRPTHTSGSTSEPIFLYQDRRELVRRETNIIEEFRYAGFVLTRPILILGLNTHLQLDIFGRRFGDDDISDDASRWQGLYSYLEEQRPKFIVGTPTSLALLARYFQKDGIEYSFHAIQFRGESMEHKLRKELSEVFQAKIIEDYGARECSTIGLECQTGKLHLALWVNYVEIVDEKGMVLPPESEGEIVVTYFENEVMPFIRYAIGDRGSLHPGRCKCGRNSPTITFAGRAREVIELPSGRCIPFLRISTAIAEHFHRRILQFQLHQVDRATLVFRYVPTATFNTKTFAALETFFNDLFNGEAVCRLEAVNGIPIGAGGKMLRFFRDDP